MAYTAQRNNGRSITDLIAVLCIFFVIGILVQPILARSRMTPGCMCQSNLKKLSKAISLYWNDYDATLPSSCLYGHSRTWNPDDFLRFAKEQGSLPTPYGVAKQSWPMVISNYISDYNCLWCPSDRGKSNSPTARISYYWKAAVDRAWYGDASAGSFQKEGYFIYPGDQIILYERSSQHYGRSKNGLSDSALIYCAFMDGHVGAIEIRDSGYTRRENPLEPLPASGVGEPAWFNYSIGDINPRFDKGQNWNPAIWADRMREVPSVCDDPAATCQSNLKKLATAVLLYTNDWDNAMPSSYLYGQSSTWNADDFVGFASKRGMLPPPPGATRSSWPMVFYSYLRSDRVLWCPSDATKSWEPSACVSYYWKAAVDAAWYGGPYGAGPKIQNINNYMYIADQIVFYERNGWHEHNKSKGLTDGVIINCAYLDGHARMKIIRDSGYTNKEIPAGPLPKSGVGEPAWFNYSFEDTDNTFNKGQNWDPYIWGDKLADSRYEQDKNLQ